MMRCGRLGLGAAREGDGDKRGGRLYAWIGKGGRDWEERKADDDATGRRIGSGMEEEGRLYAGEDKGRSAHSRGRGQLD
jgi:hypothetical protein